MREIILFFHEMKWNALNNCLQSFWRNKTLVLAVGDFSSSFIFHSSRNAFTAPLWGDPRYNSETLVHVHTLFFFDWNDGHHENESKRNMKEIKEMWTCLWVALKCSKWHLRDLLVSMVRNLIFARAPSDIKTHSALGFLHVFNLVLIENPRAEPREGSWDLHD